MAGSTASTATPSGPTARLWREFLAPRWPQFLISLVLAGAGALCAGALVKLLQPALDDVFAGSHGKTAGGALWMLLGAIALLALAKAGLQTVQALMVNRLGAGVVADLQKAIYTALLRADLGALSASHTGRFVGSMLYDAGLLRDAATIGLINFVQQLMILFAMAVVMMWSEWRLSLLVLLAAPVIILFLRGFSRRAGQAAKGAMDATSEVSTSLLESLDGIRIIKLENRQGDETARFETALARRQDHIVRGDNARAVAAPVSEMLMSLVVALVLAYEGWRARSGGADLGTFVAFFAALLQAGQSVRQLANYPGLLSQARAAAQRVIPILDLPAENDADGAPELVCAAGEVSFRRVGFAYTPDEPVVREVDLAARRGERIALVGPSGAGKSTLFNLVPRFFTAGEGVVAIDGQDVRSVRLASLRRAVAMVTQEPFLFDDSIAANIAYAAPEAAPAAIQAAAEAARVDEFALRLPDGYATRVGEGGMRLSGGERQRIAIARAFLKNAPILLLDEATSALDAHNEALIQEALERLMAGRTTLIIAHRLATVQSCDRIYVLEGGRIVEVGAPAELQRQGGLYARLAAQQMSGP